MLRFSARRLASMAVVLVAVSVVTYAVFILIPANDPAARIAGRSASAETLATVRRDFGFDRPRHVQYYELMKRSLDGSLMSYSDRTNVRAEIVRGIPATASLVLGAALIWLTVGVALGVLGAIRAGGPLDRALAVLAVVGISLPVFWLGGLLLHYLTFEVELLPPGGYVGLTDDPLSWLAHMTLPWFTLALVFAGFYSRLVRSNVLDTLGQDYVRAARAKGLSERRVLVRHVLRTALIPTVTLFGLDFAAALGGGAILTESIFDLQGVGQYAAESVGSLDLPPIMGTTLYAAFLIVVLSALADIAYAWLDPRVRASS